MRTHFVRPLTRGLYTLVAFLGVVVSSDALSEGQQGPVEHQVQPSAAVARFDQGVLWRIENDHSGVSFLLGTMHVEDPRVTDLPPPVQEAFERSTSLTTETLLGIEQMLEIGPKLLLVDGTTLQDLIGNALYAQVTDAFRARGLVPEIAVLLRPWAAALLLSQPKAQTGLFLDWKLYQAAEQNGKTLYGLETLDEQLDIFNQLDLHDQITLLEETLRETDVMDELLEKLTQAYLAQDTGRLSVIANEEFSASPVQQKLKQQLLFDRNARMAERMKPRLEEGNAFIAIGALHLPGGNGVLSLLQQMGYQLTRLY